MKDILNDDEHLSDEEILRYLEEGAPGNESAFISEALEGLKAVNNKKDIQQYVDELNRQLVKQTAAKRERKARRKLKEQPWIMVTVAVVLMLCILAYFVIRLSQR